MTAEAGSLLHLERTICSCVHPPAVSPASAAEWLMEHLIACYRVKMSMHVRHDLLSEDD